MISYSIVMPTSPCPIKRSVFASPLLIKGLLDALLFSGVVDLVTSTLVEPISLDLLFSHQELLSENHKIIPNTGRTKT